MGTSAFQPDNESADTPSNPTFTSSFSSFGLRPPASRSTPLFGTSATGNGENGSMQLDQSMEAYPLFSKRPAVPSPFGSAFSSTTGWNPSFNSPNFTSSSSTPGFAFAANSFRKNSTLGLEPILPSSQLDSPSPPDGSPHDSVDQQKDATFSQLKSMGENPSRSGSGSNSPMIIGSPSTSTNGNMFPPSSRQQRSRTPSEVNFTTQSSGIPASPVAIARVLQMQGQRTPPPFLQRKLFNGMSEETRGGDAIEDDQVAGLSLAGLTASGGSGSGEESGTRSGVVRRAVARKPNLLPKSKSHLRVLSDLRSEGQPADLAEVLSEAALHRLSRSSAACPTPNRINNTSSTTFSHPANLPAPSTSHGGLANRFPEQVDEDQEDFHHADVVSSEEEDIAAGILDDGAASDFGGTMSIGGYETEGEDSVWAEKERREKLAWLPRTSSAGLSTNSAAIAASKSPGHDRPKNDLEHTQNSPSTPNWANSTRPGKRKINDDRFEPYAAAFKRRAVSPAALSPSVPSPFSTLTQQPSHSQHSTSSVPSFGPSSSSGSLPISIPSPSLSAASHAWLNTAAPRSRAASPVPSSLSSSAGGSRAAPYLSLAARAHKEELNSAGTKIQEADLSRMSLG